MSLAPWYMGETRADVTSDTASWSSEAYLLAKSTTDIACGDDNEREPSFHLAEVLPTRCDPFRKSVIGDRARKG